MKLTHPKSDQVIDVHPAHAGPYRSQGWTSPGEESEEASPDGACPTCGATGDEPCRTSSGNETSRHAGRA